MHWVGSGNVCDVDLLPDGRLSKEKFMEVVDVVHVEDLVIAGERVLETSKRAKWLGRGAAVTVSEVQVSGMPAIELRPVGATQPSPYFVDVIVGTDVENLFAFAHREMAHERCSLHQHACLRDIRV